MAHTASSHRSTSLLQPVPQPVQLHHTVTRHPHNHQQQVAVHTQRLQQLTTYSTQAAAASTTGLMTCKRCKQRFVAAENTACSCKFHPALYSGGEVAKAIGFVRASDAPEDQLEGVIGRKGLMRFWDCCGDEDESAPGCCVGFHISFDDELNEARMW
eukprot:GHUV01023596.1.p2 GENE.GHUV01023596.1~~GHUV01023596.1.p2  ORF type:complete len:157 (+),score=39.81 GHUV01023596.1:360-830(+)